jgi:hypothetical protein
VDSFFIVRFLFAESLYTKSPRRLCQSQARDAARAVYVKFRSISEVNGNVWASAAELDVIPDAQ